MVMSGQKSGKVFYGWWVVLAVGVALSVHAAPILTFTFGVFLKSFSQEFGWSRGQISLAVSLSFLGVAVAAPFLSRLVDRFGARRVILPSTLLFGLGALCSSALGILLLWSGVDGSWAFVAAVLVGLGQGAEFDILPYAISRYFGLQAFGEIYGYTFAAVMLGAAVGPLVMGVSFDATGSYSLASIVFVGASLSAAGLMSGLGPYRVWEPSAEPVVAVGVSRA